LLGILHILNAKVRRPIDHTP